MKANVKCIAAIVASFLFISDGRAQKSSGEGLQNFHKHRDFMLRDGGKWKTINKEFNPGAEESARYFVYEFSQGINANTVHLKMLGYFPKKSEWRTIWNGLYTWDYKKQIAVYQNIHTEGIVSAGASDRISETEMSLIYNSTSPDGTVERQKYIQKLGNHQIQSTRFIWTGSKWEQKNEMLWDKLEQPSGNLTFMSTRDGNFEVYSMDANGENLKNLTCNKAIDYSFSYLPGGKLVFYSNRDGNDEIYVMDADGKKHTNITNHPASDRIASASPDGTSILFVSDRDQKSREIYKMDADGKNIVRLTHNEFFEDAPFWSPDGKKILFTRELRDLKDTSRNAVGNGEIFIMDANGTNETRLTNRPGYDGGAVFSPDGSRIAFYGKSDTGNYDIFVMNADGKNLINSTDDPVEDYSPAWSPDGKWIAFTRGSSANYDVWILHMDTNIKYRLTTHPKRDESPFWTNPKN